jgi:hypothetical protein
MPIHRIPSDMIVDRESGIKVSEQLAEIAINVKSFGAKGDGLTDDTIPIQNAINSITERGTIYFPSGTYKITGLITLDVTKVQMYTKDAILDFSQSINGGCFDFIGTVNPPYRQVKTVLEGFEIIGTGMGGTQTAIKMEAVDGAVSHINLRNLNVHNFGTGVFFGAHSYIVSFDHCDFYQCGTIFTIPPSVDSGERISFNNGTCYNSGIVLYAQNGGVDFLFNNSSLDYCTRFVDIQGATVFINQSHIEFDDSTTNYLFKTSGGKCGIHVTNSSIIGTNPNPVGTYSAFHCEDLKDFIVIENCNVHGTPTDRLVTGNGYTKVKTLNGVTNSKLFVPSNLLSALPDPTLEGTNPLQQFAITTTGTATVTIDSTTSASGTKSLKFTKSNIADSCMAIVDIPMRMGDKGFADFKHKYLNVVQGVNVWEKWYVSYSYVDAYGNQLMTYETFFDGTLSSFTKVFADYFQNNQPPIGTSKLRITFSMNGTGTAWIDDIYINIC